jgi:hypothetical protein
MAMVIELDDKVAAALQAQADALRLSLPEFLNRIAASAPQAKQGENLTDEEFDRLIEEASDDTPSLPGNFSREDIYFDHD